MSNNLEIGVKPKFPVIGQLFYGMTMISFITWLVLLLIVSLIILL